MARPLLRQAGMRKDANGFTIIELLVVMMIATIVAGMTIPSIDFVNMEVSSAGRQVSMTLLRAQRLAVLRQHDVVVAFDTANRRLRIHADRDNDGVIDNNEVVEFVQLERAAVFGRGSAPAMGFGDNPVELVRTQDAMPAVTFHRSGTASENGGLYLTSVRDAQAGDRPNHARALQIERATGRVSYFQYGTTWRRLN